MPLILTERDLVGRRETVRTLLARHARDKRLMGSVRRAGRPLDPDTMTAETCTFWIGWFGRYLNGLAVED